MMTQEEINMTDTHTHTHSPALLSLITSAPFKSKNLKI